MKPVTLFYQPRCPFCIRMIDELAEPEVADRYDYYYVPTFYVGDKKVHEGGIMPDEVEAVLRMALDER